MCGIAVRLTSGRPERAYLYLVNSRIKDVIPNPPEAWEESRAGWPQAHEIPPCAREDIVKNRLSQD